MLQRSRRATNPTKKKWISYITAVGNCHVAHIFGVDYFPEFISRLMLYIDEKYDPSDQTSRDGLDNLVARTLSTCSEKLTNSLFLVVEAHGWKDGTFNSEGSTFSAPVFKTVLTLLYYTQVWKIIRLKESRDITQISSRGIYHDDDNLALSFVPTILHGLVTQTLSNMVLASPDSPKTSSFTGACLLADISGFTKMSAMFCEKGLSGLDDLHKTTSGFLGQYVQVVYAHGGDGKRIINILLSVFLFN
jgi:hypothetical protein